jgi:hypothetical protein
MAWLRTNDSDPLTGSRLASKRLFDNVSLRQTIERWREEHPDYVDDDEDEAAPAAAAVGASEEDERLASPAAGGASPSRALPQGPS